MNRIIFIQKSFHLLWQHQPRKLLLIFLLTLVLGINTGFSVVLLIPLLELLNVGSGMANDGFIGFFHTVAGKAGIPLTIEIILAIFVLLLLITTLLQYWKTILDTRYQQTFIYALRSRLFEKIIHADWHLLNQKSKTNHLQVLSKEVPNLANYYYFYLRLVTTVILLVSYVGYALLVSVKFTLLITVIAFFLFVMLRRYLFKAFHIGEGIVDSYNQLLKYIDDFWQTVKIAKVHNSEAFYYKKFDEANASLLDLEYRMQKNYSLPQLIYRIAGIIVLVMVIYLGYKVEQLPLASFFILIILFSRIYPQFVSINTDVNMIISNVPSVKLVMQLDHVFPGKPLYSDKISQQVTLEEKIEIRNLAFSFDDGDPLIHNFNETIPANKITGIIGESGSGKTTLIDLVAGLRKPVAGQILVDGKPLNQQNMAAWKAGIGYLPQDSFFIDGTLRENLVWDSHREIADKEILNILQKVNALYLLERLNDGLNTTIVNYAFHFSGGECQRLALARVLLREPRVLILDEATSSLDSENEKQIMDVLSELKNRVTVLFVTHRTSVLKWCDKVIEIK